MVTVFLLLAFGLLVLGLQLLSAGQNGDAVFSFAGCGLMLLLSKARNDHEVKETNVQATLDDLKSDPERAEARAKLLHELEQEK